MDERAAQAMLALDLVTAIRREIPGLGTKKLFLLLREPLQKSGIAMGRDRLHELLRIRTSQTKLPDTDDCSFSSF